MSHIEPGLTYNEAVSIYSDVITQCKGLMNCVFTGPVTFLAENNY